LEERTHTAKQHLVWLLLVELGHKLEMGRYLADILHSEALARRLHEPDVAKIELQVKPSNIYFMRLVNKSKQTHLVGADDHVGHTLVFKRVQCPNDRLQHVATLGRIDCLDLLGLNEPGSTKK
jgi:hypothetical protein